MPLFAVAAQQGLVPLRPAPASSLFRNQHQSKRQFRVRRGARASAAPRDEDGSRSELARGTVLGELIGKALGGSTDSNGATHSPTPESGDAVKPGGVFGAALAALMLVRAAGRKSAAPAARARM